MVSRMARAPQEGPSAMPRSVFSLFLSSTSQDLGPYRDKVREMIARMRQTAIAMETFGARPTKPLATCRDEVQQCDALIVVVGYRYGWIPSVQEGGDGKKSITWWEVQWALDAGKPVYAFMVDLQAPWNAPREQDRLMTASTDLEIIEIGRAVQSLKDFRVFLEKRTTRDSFTSPDDLGGKVATSLHDWLLQQAVAAVRATMATTSGGATPLPGLPAPVAAPTSASEVDNLFWQEQIHLLSAQRIAGRGDGARIALIAGRANTQHPALAGAAIRQFDARSKPDTDDFDDYTTAIAALLVGGSSQAFTGVVPDANLLIVQVLDSMRSTTTADMHAGVDAAIREGAQVICLTLGGAPSSEADRKIYADAAKLGVAVVCAAGNEPNDEKRYPAAYPDCIGVTTVDETNRLASFSTFGDWVTVAAPGLNLSLPAGKAEYQTWSGGSFSCTIVAGTVALMLKQNPELDPGAIKRILGSVGPRVLHAGEPCTVATFRMLDACAAIRAATHKNED
jgi:subtilase family protein/uncharacterized protein DUF4062